ncbi:fumarate hydratase C-terminal domain-containing protein [Serratia ureilytica]
MKACRSTSRIAITTPARPKRRKVTRPVRWGPTTTAGLDSYVDLLQSHGGSAIMLAKATAPAGNGCLPQARRFLSRQHRRPGGGAGAAEHQEPGVRGVPLRAGHGSDLENRGGRFPAFILVDDKGNDFFQKIRAGQCSAA